MFFFLLSNAATNSSSVQAVYVSLSMAKTEMCFSQIERENITVQPKCDKTGKVSDVSEEYNMLLLCWAKMRCL